MAEEIAWMESGQEPDKRSNLVRPSGSLDCPIAHHLNQPSCSTSFKIADEVVDPSNGRIAMVMGNGANDGQTLIFDHMSRRSENSEGMDEHPQEVVRAHEEFSTRTTASSTAKVELLYGLEGQFDPTCYRGKKRRSKIPSASELGLQKAEKERLARQLR
ncbi:MAG: hypothetical protein GOMPHAMPRED_006718 [Gomphillus americanus]|uniref:Uncharacterized protein n=1 Tax=Gomphillus americanus TaxID=1940652 RepID=A0A8H3EPH0_9LECA|nr:MAG: hypothetical protein GOMPHAMPRED_006718 [Gomphillus americanus]